MCVYHSYTQPLTRLAQNTGNVSLALIMFFTCQVLVDFLIYFFNFASILVHIQIKLHIVDFAVRNGRLQVQRKPLPRSQPHLMRCCFIAMCFVTARNQQLLMNLSPFVYVGAVYVQVKFTKKKKLPPCAVGTTRDHINVCNQYELTSSVIAVQLFPEGLIIPLKYGEF